MIGDNIKKIRNKKRVTQEELAKLMGVSRQAICMWETDKRELKVTTLNKLAKVLGVSIKELMGGVKISEKGEKKIRFELNTPQAKQVRLAGDFNSWGKEVIALKKDSKGLWSAIVNLVPGRYQYKFIVDGVWISDPSNSMTVRNQFGTENSVKEVSLT